MTHRITTALVAIASLLMGMQGYAQEQTPVEVPQPPPVYDEVSGTPAAPPTKTSVPNAVVIEEGQKLNSLTSDGAPVIVRGHVRNDVTVTNGDVTIEPSGRIDGTLYLSNGRVFNESRSPLRLERSERRRQTPPAVSALIATPPRLARNPSLPVKRNDTFGAQFGLFILGLLGGVISLVAAPRATTRVSAAIAGKAGQCLAVGGLSALGIGIIALINAGLIRSPIGLFWMPLGFVVATVICVSLGFSWLCGMRFAGDWISERMGRSRHGNPFGRMALGLGVVCFGTALLGGVSSHLGMAGLLTHVAITLMGLGAAMTTHFGAEKDWRPRSSWRSGL